MGCLGSETLTIEEIACAFSRRRDDRSSLDVVHSLHMGALKVPSPAEFPCSFLARARPCQPA